MSGCAGGSRSPSPDVPEVPDCASSCRSSRAESEVPLRRFRSAAGSAARSRRSSRRSSRRGSPAGTDCTAAEGPRDFCGEAAEGPRDICGEAANGRKAKSPAVAAGGSAWTTTSGVAHSAAMHETQKTLYHSIPHAGGAFRLLRQICYPCDPPGVAMKCRDQSQNSAVDGESAEYEATGEMHLGDGAECSSSRSVVRQGTKMVKSVASCLALGMLPDPVHGRSALAICVGDANGRVNYYEVGVGPHVRQPRSIFSASPPAVSIASTVSRSLTDIDFPSYSTSMEPDSSFAPDVLRFQWPPIRRHSHQAYVHEMDCLTSVTILQSVRTLRLFRNHESPNTVSYLTSNERVIKLFRVPRDGFSPFHAFPGMESVVGKHLACSHYFPCTTPPSLILPVRVFSGCHSSLIQDLSICADGQTFLSVDDLQVFWWNLECAENSKGVCIADYRPVSGRMEDVEELVTAAAFHPSHSSLFLVGRSSGVVSVGDLRDPPSRSERQFATSMQVCKDTSYNEQYSEILCSISDANFLGSNYVVSRDYLTLKLWDLRNPSTFCSTVPVMNYVSPYLDKLYESDAIFDRFPISVDHMSGTVLTGLYDEAVSVWQPLSEGKLDANDSIAYYRADSRSLPCEVEGGGRTTVEALRASLASSWEALKSENSFSDKTLRSVPEAFLNKVVSLSVADGGERFAFSCSDGQIICLFERGTTMGDGVRKSVNKEEEEEEDDDEK